jgi:hypothetical protein
MAPWQLRRGVKMKEIPLRGCHFQGILRNLAQIPVVRNYQYEQAEISESAPKEGDPHGRTCTGRIGGL